MGDFTVDCTHYEGMYTYNITHTSYDYRIEASRNYDVANWHINGSIMPNTNLAMGKLIKIIVTDGFHEIYTVILKITDGPAKNIQLKTLLTDNIKLYTKQLPQYGVENDYPVSGTNTYWYLIDYTVMLSQTGITCNVRITDGKVSFISGNRKGLFLVYCNPKTNMCVLIYRKSNDNYVYWDLTEDDLQPNYDAIITKIKEPVKMGLSVIENANVVANFDPYNQPKAPLNAPNKSALDAANWPIAPPVVSALGPESGFKFAFDGDYVVVSALAPISSLEFHFNTTAQYVMILNATTLVAPDAVKSVIEPTTAGTTITVNIADNNARLMFMNAGQSITRKLSYIKFNLNA
ncbi:hypothetical protein D5b_00373 [Faustovirus]|nr:hypothetical protein D5b_00373 [Faustovirus]AMN84541.1 hypothetical protein D6_00134 [Faustovirus]AMP44316.1 hypothetical protein PRJ_Dakar_00364 [Faustovirus]